MILFVVRTESAGVIHTAVDSGLGDHIITQKEKKKSIIVLALFGKILKYFTQFVKIILFSLIGFLMTILENSVIFVEQNKQ